MRAPLPAALDVFLLRRPRVPLLASGRPLLTARLGLVSSVYSAMSAPPPSRPPKAAAKAKRPVRILMLHGYTQSGPLFRAKTRALEKMLQKMLAPFDLAPVMLYPTAPNRLRARDIPGFVAQTGAGSGSDEGADNDDDDTSDAWAWWRRDDGTGGTYRFLREGMQALAATIREAGGVDGVVGFSQGGAAASVLTAALETARMPPASSGGYDWSWVHEVRAANGQRPLRFAVVYSGFRPAPAEMQWMYAPPITTPTLHYLGGLDTVVDEARSQELIDCCVRPTVLTHPGGHYVPISKEWVMPLVAFTKTHAEDVAVADGNADSSTADAGSKI